VKVLKATSTDLLVILAWLKEEYDAVGTGFWSNETIISKSLGIGDLWVIRRDGGAVAFQVGDYAAEIACVRKDCQRQGLGSKLFMASLARATRAGANVMEGQCSPSSSLPFWESKGFVRYGGEHSLLVRKIIQRSLKIPSVSIDVNVTITFFPARALYPTADGPGTVHCLNAGRTADGVVHLAHRVVGLDWNARRGSDLTVKIEVDGERLCFCPAGLVEAQNLGVRRDFQGTYFVDAILPTAGCASVS
jgi:GNAT superfamily N-acetyltransferase